MVEQQRTFSQEPVPPEVAQAAAARGLGTVVYAQKGSNPFSNLAWGLGISLGMFFVGCLGLGWFATLIHFRPLAFVAFFIGVSAVVWFVRSLLAVFAGFTASYLYTNGLVHTKNKKIEAVAWPEVDELLLWKAGGKPDGFLYGKLLNYYIMTFDGRKIAVEAQSAKGDKTLGEQLQQAVARVGRPVKDSGPYTGRLRA